MKVAFFSTHSFDREAFDACNQARHQLVYLETPLSEATAELAAGFPAICVFVNDRVNRPVLEQLARGGTRLVALRSAGFNHVDLEAASQLGLTVARVPAYSPHAVAEHAVGLMLNLNRKFHRAYARTREHNFRLEGLLGFDFHGRTVGLVGLGQIGRLVARIMLAFGCNVLAHDPVVSSPPPGVRLVELDELLSQSDVVSLHCPLTPQTRHLISEPQLALMKRGALLVNTGRGGLIDSRALVGALKSGHLGGLGLDVYEEEEKVFFRDLSEQPLGDDVLARLLTFPNVLVTAHQGFFTRDALHNIATTTLDNLSRFEESGGVDEANRVTQ